MKAAKSKRNDKMYAQGQLEDASGKIDVICFAKDYDRLSDQLKTEAAVLLRGTELERCVASRGGARVLSVEADGDGGTVEHELPVTPLAGALPAPGTAPAPNVASARVDEAFGVSELRALRGGRHRWD